MKYIKNFRKKFARIILISFVLFGIAFHQLNGMQIAWRMSQLLITLAGLMQRSPVVVDALTKAVESVKHAILGGHTQEAIKQSDEMYNAFKNYEAKKTEGISNHKVNIEHIETPSASPEQINLEQQYLYTVVNTIAQSSLNKNKSKNPFERNPVDLTTLGKEHLFGMEELKLKQAEKAKIQEAAQRQLNNIVVRIGLLAKDLGVVCRKAVAQMAREDLEDEQIAREIDTNPIFAQAFAQAYQYAMEVISKAISVTGDDAKAYKIEMNKITLPGSYGRAYNALVEKLNSIYFNKDGSFVMGMHPDDIPTIASLVSNFVKASSFNNEEYFERLEYIANLSQLNEFNKELAQAQAGKVKFAAENGFIRFCCKILPERFTRIGKIQKSIILKNKHHQYFLEFIRLCKDHDLSDPVIKKFLVDYDKNFINSRENCYAAMNNYLNNLDKQEKLIQSHKNLPKVVDLNPMPKVSNNFGAGPGPNKAENKEEGAVKFDGAGVEIPKLGQVAPANETLPTPIFMPDPPDPENEKDRLHQQKIKDYELGIAKLEHQYTAKAVEEVINKLKISTKDILNSINLLEQIEAETLKVCIERGIAILKNGYYHINGFKLTEYYYHYLQRTGRPAMTLIARKILELATDIKPDLKKADFLRYTTEDWEMVYNPITNEIWHIQQINKV